MGKFTSFAAASVVALAAASAANATAVTPGFFFDTNSVTLMSPNDTWSESYELGFLTSFDVAFSGTGLSVDVPALSYEISLNSDGTVIADGIFGVDAGPLTSLNTIESFLIDEDFTVSIFATGLTNDFSLTASVVAPSAVLPPAVPLPAALPLLAAGLGGLAMVRRRG